MAIDSPYQCRNSRSFASPARTTRTETDFLVGVTSVPTPQPPISTSRARGGPGGSPSEKSPPCLGTLRCGRLPSAVWQGFCSLLRDPPHPPCSRVLPAPPLAKTLQRPCKAPPAKTLQYPAKTWQRPCKDPAIPLQNPAKPLQKPRRPQEASEKPREPPKKPPRGPAEAQRGPQTAPRGLKTASNMPPRGLPRYPNEHPRGP